MLKRKNFFCKLAGTWFLLCLFITGCSGWKKGTDEREVKEKIALTICVAESQWDESVEELTQLYLDRNPHIEDIQWILVPKASYWDLMNMKLATDTMPDIMEIGVGEELEEWYPHLVPLDDVDNLEDIFPELLQNGKIDGHYYSIPQAIYGRGILYNMDMLQDVGWLELPKTKEELRSLCEDMEEAGMFQFMNPYHEITTWVECGMAQMISMRNTPKLYAEHLKRAKHRPIDEDEGWNALLDFCDLTLEYGNRRPIQLNTNVARNYFYIGRYAMILNESARGLTDMKAAGQGVDLSVRIGPMLVSDEAEKNGLLMDTVRLGVTEHSAYPEEAKAFLAWLIGDEEAVEYQKRVMHIMPVMETACEEGLCSMAQETYEYYKSGRMTPELIGYLPMDMAEATGEEWARYITGESSREEFFQVYEAYWRQYAENN